MTPIPQSHMSSTTGNTSAPEFPRSSRAQDDLNLMKAPSYKGGLPSSGSLHGEKLFNPSNGYFDNIGPEDVNTFFDFDELRSGVVTPREQEASSKAPIDFGFGWEHLQPLSPPDSAVYPADDWQHFDSTQVPQTLNNILTQIDPSRTRAQFGQTTPPDEDLSSSLEYQLSQQQYRLPSPKSPTSNGGTKRKVSATEKSEASAPSKRVRKSTARSRNGGEVDPTDPDGNHRSKFLERNRVAASKCRQKKKEWTQNLETKARDLQKHNQELRMLVDSYKEEILFLKGEMLKHTACGCSSIQEYLQQGANSFLGQREAVIKRETSAEASMPPSPVLSLSSSRNKNEKDTPTSATKSISPSLQRSIEENLEALLQPQYAHDTSEEGIARQMGSQ